MSDGVSLPVRVGDTIAGKYQVERVLGTGSMGVVVAAMHVDLHELRAIKLMLPGPLADAEAVALAKRFAVAGVGLAVALFGAGRWVTWRSVDAAPTVPAVTAIEGMTAIATALTAAPTVEPATAAPTATATAAATPTATPSTSAEGATPPAATPRGVAPPFRPNIPTDIRLQR